MRVSTLRNVINSTVGEMRVDIIIIQVQIEKVSLKLDLSLDGIIKNSK